MTRAALVAILLAGCATPPAPASEPSASRGAASALPAALESGVPYEPAIDPAAFVEGIDNSYLPLVVGTRWVYEGTGDAEGEVTTVEVLAETRTVMGVVCTVVSDEVTLDGEPIEITKDWFVQDVDGNVWYFGEETVEYENGEVVSTAGAWEAGVDGAQPGIVMPANPQVGVTYRQEFYPGEAEDMAKVLETGQSVEVPFGSFVDVLVTEEWTPLEPDVAEHKLYATGIGMVKEEIVRGGEGTFELVTHETP
jgi:hypothetical protein